MKTKHAFILALLITLLIAFNFFLLKTLDKSNRKIVFVSRVIDGDTLELENGQTIRLLNINTPEKKENGYEASKNFLKNIENKTIEIEETGTDKYDRTLVRIFNPEYLNLELVKNGLAKKFLVQDNELKEFSDAEKQAVENEKGTWKKSLYFSCFSSSIDSKLEVVHLKNNCKKINIDGWSMTDESRKKYIFKNVYLGEMNIYSLSGKENETDLFWSQTQNVWNNDRDTLYLYDSESKIVNYNSYGY